MNDAEIGIRLVRESRKDWQYMLLEVDKVSEQANKICTQIDLSFLLSD